MDVAGCLLRKARGHAATEKLWHRHRGGTLIWIKTGLARLTPRQHRRQPSSISFQLGPGQAFAYLVGTSYHVQNAAKIIDLARKADTLFIEAVSLHGDREIAAQKRHLRAALPRAPGRCKAISRPAIASGRIGCGARWRMLCSAGSAPTAHDNAASDRRVPGQALTVCWKQLVRCRRADARDRAR
jgi:hypothetical protein